MNQRGEATLMGILLLVALSGLLTLTGLQLERSFRFLRARGKLLLCAKELRLHLDAHLRLIGQTNWVIQNAERAKFVALVIPGLQAAGASAEKIKKMAQGLQDLKLIEFRARLAKLASRGCTFDPRIVTTPLETDELRHRRGITGAKAALRSHEWTSQLWQGPYLLSLSYHVLALNRRSPKFKVKASVSVGKPFSPSSWSSGVPRFSSLAWSF